MLTFVYFRLTFLFSLIILISNMFQNNIKIVFRKEWYHSMNQTTSASVNSNRPLTTSRLVRIALVTAVTCILAPMSIPIPLSPVPITLTNLVLLTGLYVLNWKDSLISYVIYLLIGLAGLPVFSGFSGGPGKIAGPTGGYLAGFLIMLLIAGLIVHASHGKRIPSIFGMILGSAATYLFGTLWLAFQMDLGFMAALSIGVLPYLAGDLIKILIAAGIGPVIGGRIKSIEPTR